jgi:HSP20 family molecular chaperone IbpA
MIMLPSLTRRGQAISPFDALWDMRREMDRMFGGSTEAATQAWAMPAEVVETDNEIRFVVEAAGLRPEDLDVTVENNVLTISGEKKVERNEGERASTTCTNVATADSSGALRCLVASIRSMWTQTTITAC